MGYYPQVRAESKLPWSGKHCTRHRRRLSDGRVPYLAVADLVDASVEEGHVFRAWPAVHVVHLSVHLRMYVIVAGAAFEGVGALVSVQVILAIATVDRVAAGLARVEPLVPVAPYPVLTFSAVDRVAATPAIYFVGAGGAVDLVFVVGALTVAAAAGYRRIRHPGGQQQRRPHRRDQKNRPSHPFRFPSLNRAGEELAPAPVTCPHSITTHTLLPCLLHPSGRCRPCRSHRLPRRCLRH